MKGVLLFMFAISWSTLVLLFDGIAGHSLWKQFKSGHYPFTTGVITHSEVTMSHGRRVRYGVNIQYSYEVNGHAHYGFRVRYGSIYAGEATPMEIVSTNRVGSQTRVYFNPGNPEDAILSPDVEGGDLMLMLLFVPFNIATVGLGMALGALLGRTICHPVAGGVKIIVDGPRTNIRLPEYGALALGMCTTGILSFISLFIVGFSTGLRPSKMVVGLALFLMIAAGVAAYLWRWSKIHSGEYDLVLDETSSTITLPKTFGRKERVKVERGKIEGLSVETIEHHGSKGGTSYTYAPVLWLKERRGGEKLADWSDNKRAVAFAGWLIQKLNLREARSTADYRPLA